MRGGGGVALQQSTRLVGNLQLREDSWRKEKEEGRRRTFNFQSNVHCSKFDLEDRGVGIKPQRREDRREKLGIRIGFCSLRSSRLFG
jgi:hypothetical protein